MRYNLSTVSEHWKLGIESLRLEIPWIASDAIAVLNKLLTEEMTVLDLGTGGSTLFYARRVKHVLGIETDARWKELVEKALYDHGIEMYATMTSVSQDAIYSQVESFVETYDVISVDTMYDCNHRILRDRLASIAVTKLASNGIMILDNWKCGDSFGSMCRLTGVQLTSTLNLPDHVAVDFSERRWIGEGTRLLMPKALAEKINSQS